MIKDTITISREKIILIALIYNYIVNDKTELQEWIVNGFVKAVEEELKYLDDEWKIDKEEDPIESYYINKFLEKDTRWNDYKLIDLVGLATWYKFLPRELVHITLKEKVLAELYIDKKNIPLSKEYIYHSNHIEIYSSEGTRALESARRILESEGSINIKLGYPCPKQLSADVGFSIPYTCSKCFERADLSIIQERVKQQERKAIDYAIEGANLFEKGSLNLKQEPDERTNFLSEVINQQSSDRKKVRKP